MNDKTLKKIIEDDLKYISSIPVQEYTLYRKWSEIQEKYSFDQSGVIATNLFFGPIKTNIVDPDIMEVERNLWIPNSSDDYEKLIPEVVPVVTKKQNEIWNILRVFTSTAFWNGSPGRLAKYYIIDKNTDKYLGIISLGSDFIAIGGRDKYIGWSYDQRISGNKMLNYICMGSSIVPTQPLGYNGAGGKLIALLVLSEPVINYWNDLYPDENLVGITTTSLYGSMSQYTRLKYWKKCDSTEGQTAIEPGAKAYKDMRDWMHEHYPDELRKIECMKEDGSIPSHPKVKMIHFVMKKLNIKPVVSNFTRGVFFGSLYTKTKEFLCEKSNVPGEKLFDNSVKALTELWKEKYMIPRLKNVIESNRYNTDTLFYSDLIRLNWEETKEKYLKEVGR